MNFQLTEEQKLIQKTAREFAVAELVPGAIERDEKKIWPREAVTKMAELGFMGIIGSLLFAGFDELLQSFVPGRFPSIYDVIADLIGFTIIVGTMYYYSRKRTQSISNG